MNPAVLCELDDSKEWECPFPLLPLGVMVAVTLQPLLLQPRAQPVPRSQYRAVSATCFITRCPPLVRRISLGRHEVFHARGERQKFERLPCEARIPTS